MEPAIIIDMLENAALLLAMAVAFDLASGRRPTPQSLPRKLVAGFAIGAIGVAMIATSLRLETGVIFDTRSVLLSVAGLFLGWVPMLVAVATTAVYRFFVGGVGATAGFWVIVSSGLIGALWRRLRRGELGRISMGDLYALGLVVHVVMLAILLAIPGGVGRIVVGEVWRPVLLVHPIATVALGLLFARRLRHWKITEELRESEERFRRLAENAQDLIYRFEVVPTRRFSYVSPSVRKLLGYTPEEFYADPDILRKIIHPDDQELLVRAFKSSDSSDIPNVLRWIHKDGRIVWSERRSTPIQNESGKLVAFEGIARDVTAVRETLNAFIEQGRRLELALESSNQAIYNLDVATGIETVTEQYARMLGEEPQEIHETLAEWIGRIHPDDQARVAAALDDFLASRATEYRVETRRRHRDGRWIWTHSYGTVVERDADGKPARMIGTIQDVTALKTAELEALEAHAQSERLLAEARDARQSLLSVLEAQEKSQRQLQHAQQLAQSTLDALKDNICVLDRNGFIVAVNAAWRRFAATNGASEGGGYLGWNYIEVCDAATGTDADEAHDVASQLRALIDARIESYSIEYACHAPHEQRWFRVQMIRFEIDGSPRVVVAHENVSERRLAEEEHLELTKQLFQSQKLESLGSLAGGVAHDINNVLAAISNAALTHRPQLGDGEPLARALDTIMNACVRGRSVVKSLLYFARRELGSFGLVDLNAVAREIVALLGQTTLKRVSLTTEFEEPLPRVWGDAAALSHAVMNLCLNSVDAMPNGGTITVGTARRAGSTVEIFVRDNGMGMSPEVKARAVEPFFTTKPLGKGTGLGLAMVFGTIEAHGGTCAIESEPGRGTEVTLSFPAVSDEATAFHREPEAAQEEPPVASLRILLVDDDELILESLPDLLEAMGHHCETANGGLAAIARLEAGLEVDLVILDMNMPGLTGAETLPRILELRPEQSVLISSGFSETEPLGLAPDNPRIRQLRKPFTGGELEDALSSLFSPSRRQL